MATKKQRPGKSAGRSKLLKWIVVAGVLVVDFSGLDAKQKRSALETANAARCACGCGMTLAQCVATDSTCPVREGNVDRIKGMVDHAARTKS